ncbi:MAG: hypothetical protein Kow0068_19820 [Marinilabiliales bacterium]
MKKIVCFQIVLFFIVIQIFGQQNEIIKAQDYLQKKGEVYFKFTIQNSSEIQNLTKIISIDKVTPTNEVFAYANQNEFNKFLNLQYSFEVLTPPGDLIKNPEMYDGTKGIWDFDTYPTYPEYVSMMNTFAANYPNLCRIVDIGGTVDGRRLLYAVISDNVNTREAEPRFSYSSSMHGDETTGYVTLLRLINYLLTNYGSITQVTNLVDNCEIWICPLENPDGTYAGGDNTVSGATRYNGNNIDLNRNYPDMIDGDHPDGNAWQPETIHMMNLFDSLHFVASGNFHGGAEVANYPWDTKAALHADDDWFQLVSLEFASQAQANGPSSYFTSVTSNGITNGYAWYEANGSRQDFNNYFRHCREITFEISNTKLPAASNLPTYWNALYPSLLDYIEQCTYGIRGIITDNCTGNPIVANVTIQGHDFDNSDVYSELPLGDYYRPIKAGTYTVIVSAPGYQTQTFSNVTVTDYNATILNVSLVPDVPVADFSASETTSCNGQIDFTCLTGGVDTWLWDFGDGNTSTLENPTHTYTSNGTYTVTLTVSNCNGANSDTEIKTNYITINAPAVPTVTDGSNCGPGSVSLSANASGTIEWYDASTGGNLVNTGTNYTTPSLTNTTTYYVENVETNSTTYYVGNTASSSSGSFHNGGYYITFDVYQPLIIRSVEINAQNSGTVSVDLVDDGGTTIQSTSVSVSSGVSRINLDFSVSPGSNYGLKLTSGIYLWRNNSGVSYPYEVSGLISLTSSTAGSGYYYYFYDWEVEQADTCRSGRVPVTATIENPVNVSVNINASSTTICSGQSVTFTATSTNGGTSPIYNWLVNGSSVQSGSSNTFTTTSLVDGDIVTCELTSSEPCNDGPATSNSITITVTPPVNVSVSVSASATTICSGESVTFTATPTNGGTTPAYEWFINGTSVQSGASNTYTTSSLNDGDVVTCTLTSSEPCNDGPATSSPVAITVSPTLNVDVTINASSTSICDGENVTFTASPVNGGTSPVYQWQVNSTNAGTNSNQFSSSTLNNGDVITCILTSSENCNDGPATSNAITMAVTPVAPIDITITPSATTICNGVSVTFTSNSVNTGSSPIYTWFVNGTQVQTGSNSSYTSSTFNDGDVVTCELTSSLPCNDGPATSNSVTINVNDNVVVDNTIVASSTSICTGESVTFTATATNEGTNPVYEWFINGLSVQSGTSNSYTTSSLNDNDNVYCIVTSSESCAINNPATSNTISMIVSSSLPVSATISGNTDFCAGDLVTITANALNEGASPSYDWYVNGSLVQSGNSDTYSSSTFNDNDNIYCVVTSSLSCATSNPATSDTLTLNVNASLPVSLTITGNTSICSGESVTYTATGTNGGSSPIYEWFVNGNSVQSGISDTYTTSTLNSNDVITCVLTSSASCATGSPATSNAITVTVNPSITAAITINGNTNACNGDNITINATPVNPGTSPTYNWYINGSLYQSGSNDYITSNSFADGNIVTCLMQSSEQCVSNNPVSSNALNIIINDYVDVDVTITGNNTVCSGETVTFSASPVNEGSNPAYEWLINGSVVQSGNNSDYTTSTLSDGDIITCILTSSETCTNNNPDTSNAITMTVNPLLDVSVNISGNTSLCAGDMTTFTATETNQGTNPVFDWYVNGILITSGNQNVFQSDILNNNDVVMCILTSDEACTNNNPANSNYLTVTVEDIPVADFMYNVSNFDVTFTNLSLNAQNYFWDFGDFSTTNFPNPTHTYSNPGIYTVMLIASNGCGSDTVYYDVNVNIIGIHNPLTFTVTIYPNPVNDLLNIDFSNENSDVNISLLSVSGQKVMDKQFSGTKHCEIDMSDLSDGLYILSITKDNKTIRKKIVVR